MGSCPTIAWRGHAKKNTHSTTGPCHSAPPRSTIRARRHFRAISPQDHSRPPDRIPALGLHRRRPSRAASPSTPPGCSPRAGPCSACWGTSPRRRGPCRGITSPPLQRFCRRGWTQDRPAMRHMPHRAPTHPHRHTHTYAQWEIQWFSLPSSLFKLRIHCAQVKRQIQCRVVYACNATPLYSRGENPCGAIVCPCGFPPPPRCVPGEPEVIEGSRGPREGGPSGCIESPPSNPVTVRRGGAAHAGMRYCLTSAFLLLLGASQGSLPHGGLSPHACQSVNSNHTSKETVSRI